MRHVAQTSTRCTIATCPKIMDHCYRRRHRRRHRHCHRPPRAPQLTEESVLALHESEPSLPRLGKARSALTKGCWRNLPRAGSTLSETGTLQNICRGVPYRRASVQSVYLFILTLSFLFLIEYFVFVFFFFFFFVLQSAL